MRVLAPWRSALTLTCLSVLIMGCTPALDPTRPVVADSTSHFNDCDRWASLRGLLFSDCRRLELANDHTFRLRVIHRDLPPTAVFGTWRPTLGSCLVLEATSESQVLYAAPPTSHIDPGVANSNPEDTDAERLDELCEVDPDACIQVPIDWLRGWTPDVCLDPDGAVMRFSGGREILLAPRVDLPAPSL